jgi:selenocysteine lyase/cysteine desulfurase
MTVRTARMLPEAGQLDWDDLERSPASRTRLLVIGAVSNALGTINDIPRAARLAHAAGALSFVGSVHFAPHRLVDARAMGCDFLACSAYEFLTVTDFGSAASCRHDTTKRPRSTV